MAPPVPSLQQAVKPQNTKMESFKNLFSTQKKSLPPVPKSLPNDRLQAIVALKLQGNDQFKEQDYSTAANTYSKAIALMDLSTKIPKTLKSTVETLEPVEVYSQLLANRAACLLHLPGNENSKLALQDAEAVIKMRPQWNRGHVRKSMALLDLGDVGSALLTLQNITQDSVIVKLKRKLQALQRENQGGLHHYLLKPGKHVAYKTSSVQIINNLIFSFAKQLENVIHVVACKQTRQAMLLDPCWDINGLKRFCEDKNLIPVAAFLTHAHIDHAGGIPPPPFDKFRQLVPGIVSFLQTFPNSKAYLHKDEVNLLKASNPDLDMGRFILTNHMDDIVLGQLSFKTLHTPGHTQGSQTLSFSSNDYRCLWTGDLIFPSSCGRFDFEESDSTVMRQTLLNVFSELSDEVVVWPAHDYGGDFTTVGQERNLGFIGASGVSRFDAYVEKVQRELKEAIKQK